VLDPALLRPAVSIAKWSCRCPTFAAAEQILKVHMRKVPLGDNVKPSVIARGTRVSRVRILPISSTKPRCSRRAQQAFVT